MAQNKLIDITGLNVFKTQMQGWVNDKFFVGTKEAVAAAFASIPEGTFVFVTDDAVDIGDLAAAEPDSTDVESLFDEGDEPNADDLFG